ncbi:MAG: T9SS type A sorting domain-containing protein [Psychroserpens sp.]|uniref:T9SS type A sorting domain-containing protein n=1 Tax=Psychroserpens sp. TaxID=2020870 RepID=UPI00300341D4
MKYVWLLIAILCFNLSFCQNDINGEWYVHSITTAGIQHDSYVSMSISFSNIPLESEIVNDYFNYDGGIACGFYSGHYSVIDENTLSILELIDSNSCGGDAYGKYYYKYRDVITPTYLPGELLPLPFNYTIVGSGEDQVLTITNPNGDLAVYGRQEATTTIFKTWYSYSTETVNGIAYPSLIESPSLTISPLSNSSFGMGVTGSGGCNNFDATHNIYSSNENEFWIYLFNQTLLVCNDNLYEPTYLSVISTEVDAVFSYELQDDGETLVLTNTVGEVLTFGSQPLPANILGEWLLHYLVIDSNQINNPVDTIPTISFEITPNSVSPLIQGMGACNGFSSAYYFNPQQSFTSGTFGTSLVDCDTQEENVFENFYFSQVLNTGNDGTTELHYEITGTGNDATLVVTNLSNSNQAFYGRQALSVDDNEFSSSKISLSENPVADVLSFSTEENLSESNYRIFEITGKLILDGHLNSNSIDVKSLASGLYFLKVSNDTNRFETVKFIKK